MTSTASALAQEPRQFYPDALPPVGTIVIATAVRVTDTAAYCTLPAYRDSEAMIPTSEIHIKRHRRITDYIKEGQTVVAQVLRHDPMDLSMKIVRETERDAAMAAFGRDSKIHQIARTSAAGSVACLDTLLREVIWPKGCVTDATDEESPPYNGEAVIAWMRAIRGGEPGAAEGVPTGLVAAIMAGLPEPIVTQTKEVTLRFGAFHDGVARLNALLTELSAIPGLTVLVTAPPKYQLVATAPNSAAAAALLATAMARLPAAC
jgi:translation initiation factor 2 alpha subunit (eIF-2alpha)